MQLSDCPQRGRGISIERTMSREINFDEFQKEINEAERYLSHVPVAAASGSRSSMTFEPMRRSTGTYDINQFKVYLVFCC